MADKKTIEEDARGQYGKSQADKKNDGVISAIPTSITGEDDATMHDAHKKPSPKPGFDIRTQTNKRD